MLIRMTCLCLRTRAVKCETGFAPEALYNVSVRLSMYMYPCMKCTKGLSLAHSGALLICVSVCPFFSYLLVLLWFYRWINVWMESRGCRFITFGSLCSINSLAAWFLFTWLLSPGSDVKMNKKWTEFIFHLPVAIFHFSFIIFFIISEIGPLAEIVVIKKTFSLLVQYMCICGAHNNTDHWSSLQYWVCHPLFVSKT